MGSACVIVFIDSVGGIDMVAGPTTRMSGSYVVPSPPSKDHNPELNKQNVIYSCGELLGALCH